MESLPPLPTLKFTMNSRFRGFTYRVWRGVNNPCQLLFILILLSTGENSAAMQHDASPDGSSGGEVGSGVSCVPSTFILMASCVALDIVAGVVTVPSSSFLFAMVMAVFRFLVDGVSLSFQTVFLMLNKSVFALHNYASSRRSLSPHKLPTPLLGYVHGTSVITHKYVLLLQRTMIMPHQHSALFIKNTIFHMMSGFISNIPDFSIITRWWN